MINDKDIEKFANEINQIVGLAIKLADNDPLRAQQLLDTSAYLHRSVFNKSDITATMEELEDEYTRVMQ